MDKDMDRKFEEHYIKYGVKNESDWIDSLQKLDICN